MSVFHNNQIPPSLKKTPTNEEILERMKNNKKLQKSIKTLQDMSKKYKMTFEIVESTREK
jgi:hypothetical protein